MEEAFDNKNPYLYIIFIIKIVPKGHSKNKYSLFSNEVIILELELASSSRRGPRSIIRIKRGNCILSATKYKYFRIEVFKLNLEALTKANKEEAANEREAAISEGNYMIINNNT